MVRCGKVTFLPPHLSYSVLVCIPHDVADWVNRWFGLDADGTAVYSLLKTPNSLAIACFTGICSGVNIVTAVPPADAPWSAEYLSSCAEYGYLCGDPPTAGNLPANVSYPGPERQTYGALPSHVTLTTPLLGSLGSTGMLWPFSMPSKPGRPMHPK
jgi:hypothetical protein